MRSKKFFFLIAIAAAALAIAILSQWEVIVAAVDTKIDANGKKAELGALKNSDAPASSPTQADSLPTIKLEPISQESIVRLTGTLTADEDSDVASNIGGIVQKVFVNRGSLVEKGDILIQLDPTDANNYLAEGTAAVEELRVRLGLDKNNASFSPQNTPEVKMAKTALDLATANLKRYTDLLQQDTVSKLEFDRMQTEYEAAAQRYEQAILQMRQLYQGYLTAQTRLKTLQKAVEDTRIVAPYTGWIVQRFVSEGERVSTMPVGGGGTRIVTLAKIDPLRLLLTVPQQQVSAIKPGLPVRFQVDSMPGKTFTGEVRYIAPSLEPNSRSLTVEAIASNADRLLQPGLFATAEIVLPETAKVILLPQSAVMRQGDSAKVFVIREGCAREQIVSLGEIQGELIQITSGLNGGETILAEPRNIRDGQKVN